MAIFNSIGEGWKLFKNSFSVLIKNPIFLVPIFISLIIFSGIILCLRYYFKFPSSFMIGLLELYIILFIIAYVICLMNLLMLEFIQQIEKGQKISLGKALGQLFSWDFFAVIPLAIIWALIWFITLIIEALLSKSKNKERSKPSIRDAARTLGGANSGPFSWLKMGLRMFEKLLNF